MKGLSGLIDKLSSSTDEEVVELFNKRNLNLSCVTYENGVAVARSKDRIAFSPHPNMTRAMQEAAILLTVVR